MRNHPVTPMTDSNIMRVMESQSRGRAGNITPALSSIRAAMQCATPQEASVRRHPLCRPRR
ncbi:four-carbon acid sugar kinase family protein [Brucella abortus]|nr:four-carbon acid sugar kinase family protein [Brucella abortus]